MPWTPLRRQEILEKAYVDSCAGVGLMTVMLDLARIRRALARRDAWICLHTDTVAGSHLSFHARIILLYPAPRICDPIFESHLCDESTLSGQFCRIQNVIADVNATRFHVAQFYIETLRRHHGTNKVIDQGIN
ncbi:hypothetical protein CO2235_U850024 [Cupriavidus oxalaticus]|uniref:Uncharacterized protein n=1 Tax=Cupriavidus oxalaticus TaxID=96344 RepID=A0A375FRG2_9BURK|nr:hypothetical protein CO2235_U850024 [Cupriavidus oxalaticus]